MNTTRTLLRQGCSGCLTLLVLLFCALFVYINWPMSAEEQQALFERYLGVPLTSDIELVSVEREGGFDFLQVRICFRASEQQLREMAAAKSLVATEPPDDAPPCLRRADVSFQRISGAGIEGPVTVHRFHSTDQYLAYDTRTGMAYYAFFGID